MYKTILIPVDLQVASLNTLVKALRENDHQNVLVILMYSEYLSDSIMDLLYYMPHKSTDLRERPDFREALEMIMNSFGTRIYKVVIKHYHGIGKSAMRNFLDACKVEEVYMPKNYAFRSNGRTFDPRKQLKASGIPYKEIEWEAAEI